MPPMTAARRRPLVAWIACLAVLAGALAPSIGHAIAAMRGLPVLMAELCSAGARGQVVIRPPALADADPADSRSDGPAQRSGTAGTHCPACLGPADPCAPPPAGCGPFAAPDARQRASSLVATAAAAAAPAWTPANPRAPPGCG